MTNFNPFTLRSFSESVRIGPCCVNIPIVFQVAQEIAKFCMGHLILAACPDVIFVDKVWVILLLVLPHDIQDHCLQISITCSSRHLADAIAASPSVIGWFAILQCWILDNPFFPHTVSCEYFKVVIVNIIHLCDFVQTCSNQSLVLLEETNLPIELDVHAFFVVKSF